MAANPETLMSGFTSTLPMLIIMGLLFYFMLIRPQTKRAQEHAALLKGLKKGDEVVTSGGIVGKVVKISGSFMTITIAEGINMTIQTKQIAMTLPKGSVDKL